MPLSLARSIRVSNDRRAIVREEMIGGHDRKMVGNPWRSCHPPSYAIYSTSPSSHTDVSYFVQGRAARTTHFHLTVSRHSHQRLEERPKLDGVRGVRMIDIIDITSRCSPFSVSLRPLSTPLLAPLSIDLYLRHAFPFIGPETRYVVTRPSR